MASLDPAILGPHPGDLKAKKLVPALTSSQQYALAALAESARRTELRIQLQRGDILFFNNWALLHRRDTYKDGAERSRHLVRLWIRNSRLGWAVPDDMAAPWRVA